MKLRRIAGNPRASRFEPLWIYPLIKSDIERKVLCRQTNTPGALAAVAKRRLVPQHRRPKLLSLTWGLSVFVTVGRQTTGKLWFNAALNSASLVGFIWHVRDFARCLWRPVSLQSERFCFRGLTVCAVLTPLTISETWYCKHCADVHGPGNYVDREGSTFSGLPDLDSQVSTTASNADEEIETPTSPPDDFSTFPEHEVEGADPSTSEQGAYDGPSSPIHNLNSSFDMPLALPMNVDGSSDTATPPSPASIAQYIYPETRVSPFALSVPQQAALDKWKAKVAYDDLQAALSSPDKINRGIVDHNLHLRYPESVGLFYIKGPPVLGCMEQGGQVVELSTDEMDGKKLSECLKLVDSRVKAEQEKIAGAREPWEEGVLQRMEWVKQEDEKAEARKIKKKEREMRASGGLKAVGSPSARLGDSSELTVTLDGGIEL